jgi:prepilin-type N-terminal cleavage/methylation domain-containing protein
MLTPANQAKGLIFCESRKESRFSGFTLIELLVVVSIIAVMSASMMPGLTNYMDTQNLIQAQEQLKSDIRTVQNNALAGVGADGTINFWGIRFNTTARTRYEFFTAQVIEDCFSGAGITVTANSDVLPGDALIRSANNTCIFFDMSSGAATYTFGAIPQSCSLDGETGCMIPIGYTASTSCFGVSVNDAGLIKSLENQPCL